MIRPISALTYRRIIELISVIEVPKEDITIKLDGAIEMTTYVSIDTLVDPIGMIGGIWVCLSCSGHFGGNHT